jgi:CRISPR/Cas system-associated endoribonuclease Cas2
MAGLVLNSSLALRLKLVQNSVFVPKVGSIANIPTDIESSKKRVRKKIRTLCMKKVYQKHLTHRKL